MTPRCRAAFLPFLTALVLLAAVPPTTAARAAEGDKELKAILESYRKDLRGSNANLDELDHALARESDAIRSKVKGLTRKRDQLILMSGAATDPWDLRDAIKGYQGLQRQADKLLVSPDDLQAKLRDGLASLQDMEAKINDRLQENTPPELSDDLHAFLAEVQNLAERVHATQASIDDILKPARDLKRSLDAANAKLQGSMDQAWGNYLTQRSPSLFSPQADIILRQGLEHWRAWFDFARDVVASGRRDKHANAPLTTSFLLTVGLCLAFWAAHRRIKRHCPTPQASQALGLSLQCLAVSLGINFLADRISFVIFSPLAAVEEVIMSVALVQFSWFLTLCSDRERRKLPVVRWLLLGAFALGLFLNALRIPDILAHALFGVTLGLLALRFFRLARQTHVPLDKRMALGCSLVLIVLTAVDLYGYFRLAILLTTLLFYVVLSVRVAVALAPIVDSWRAALSKRDLPVLAGLMSGLGFPLVFSCILFLSLYLSFARFGGENDLLRLLGREAHFDLFSLSVDRLGLVLLGYYVFKSALNILDHFIERYGERRTDMEAGTVRSLRTIFRNIWWSGFGLFVLFLLGFSFTSLTVVAGGLSVGIGFGLQQIVNNFISGLILLFGRALEVGDVIQVGDTTGVVKRVNIRNTLVQTWDNASIFVPNSTLISNQIVNWSHRDRRVRRDIDVGVAYDSDRDLVRRLLVQAALSVPRVLRDPAPDVLFWDFGPSTLNFKLRIWVPEVDTASLVVSDVRLAVDKILRENTVEIAFPQSDVHLRTAPGLERLIDELAALVRNQAEKKD